MHALFSLGKIKVGYFVYIIKNILSTIYRYEIQPPPDGNWGAEKYNGSWNGMVGQLQQRVCLIH